MSLEAYSVIELDTSQPILSVVHAKQYDTVRKVEAHLYFSGEKWYVPSENVYVMVSYKKADRVGGFYDLTEDGQRAVSVDTNDRSIIRINLDRSMVTKAGNVNTEVIFFDGVTGGRLSCFAFIVEVEEAAVRDLSLASNPYFDILSQQIANAMDAELKLAGMTASAVALNPGEQPTAVMEGTFGTGDHFNVKIGIPSMPGLTASGEKLAPNAEPTVEVTGGSVDSVPYNIKLGIPSMPSMTTEATKLAPDAAPTAVLTGGTEAGEAYKLTIGVPSMPAMNVSAEKLAPNATPTASLTGGTIAGEAYTLTVGVPSMPSMTAEATKLAPNAAPTAAISGGTTAGEAYKLTVGVPSMPSLTAEATKLAPNAAPTAAISGGTTAGQAYKLTIGVPSMPAASAAMTVLDTGSDPTVALTGGTQAGEAYTFTFGMPRNGTVNPTSTTYAYALSDNGQTVPSSGWKSSVAALGDTIAIRGKYVWTRCVQSWNDGYSATLYNVAYNGLDSSQATDATLSDESTNPVQNKVVKAALDAKLDAPGTLLGILYRYKDASDNTYVTGTAAIGLNYGSYTFTLTLQASLWSNNTLTVSNYLLTTSDKYSFIITPRGSSFTEYVNCGIYADDITTSGNIVFHCSEVPTNDLVVNVIRVVTETR